jgi:hypothetical protein
MNKPKPHFALWLISSAQAQHIHRILDVRYVHLRILRISIMPFHSFSVKEVKPASLQDAYLKNG